MTRDQAKADGLTHYTPNASCVNNHASVRRVSDNRCLECMAEKQARQRAKDPEKAREIQRKSNRNNIEKVRSRNRAAYRAAPEKPNERRRKNYANNREASIEYRRNYYNNNKEKVKATNENWRANNRGKHNASVAARNLIKERSKAYLSEADKQKIIEIYQNCPPGMVVDHIIPLRGKNICGLHVPGNLQYLTPEENMRKGNKFEG